MWIEFKTDETEEKYDAYDVDNNADTYDNNDLDIHDNDFDDIHMEEISNRYNN